MRDERRRETKKRETTMEIDEIIAWTLRSDRLDCIHYGTAIVVNANNEVLFSLGNENKRVYERSLVKPYKGIGIISSGAAGAFDFSLSDLAIMAGSHSGSNFHIQNLRKLLGKTDLSMDLLKCGTELPIGIDALYELIENKSLLTPLHCDCSGEHIGILSLCRYKGWDLTTYVDPAHPANAYFRRIIDEYLEFSSKEYSIDGCGLPTYYVPLRSLALGMAKFCSCERYLRSSRKVFEAICKRPTLYAGKKGRFDTKLIKLSKGEAISKSGAEGLYTVSFPKKKIGVAIKVADGNHRAAVPVLIRIFRNLNLLSEQLISDLEETASELIKTNDDNLVGRVISANF